MYVCNINLTPARNNIPARSRLHLLDRINEELAELRKADGRWARTIEDGQEVVDAFCDAWEGRAVDDVAVNAVDYCEFLPNSYAYRASSDRITITGVSRDGVMAVNIVVECTQASKRRNGRGATIVARLKRAGQAQGRIAS